MVVVLARDTENGSAILDYQSLLVKSFNNLQNTSASINSTATMVNSENCYIKPLISTDTLEMVDLVLGIWINSALAYLGIANNIVTIIVFTKMGFQETINISMTTIACWDLVRCFSLAVYLLYGPIMLVSVPFGVSWKNVTVVILTYLTSLSGKASGLLAAHVAIERCLCVSMPFDVKSLITRKSVTITCVAISVFVSGSYLVVYAMYDFYSDVDLEINATTIKFRYSLLAVQFPALVEYIYVISLMYLMAMLIITCICTVIIVYHLKKASDFRAGIRKNYSRDETAEIPTSIGKKKSKSSTSKHGVSTGRHLSPRDSQVVKMLITVIVVFNICTLPYIAYYITLSLVPEFLVGKAYNNLLWVSLSIVTFFNLINSSTNIYIFNSMSSEFHRILMQMLSLSGKKSK